MAKATKKPVTIDYLPAGSSLGQLEQWLLSLGDRFDDHFEAKDTGYAVHLKVRTLEGTSYDVTERDVIIRGVKGEYYPFKEDIFKATYDIN